MIPYLVINYGYLAAWFLVSIIIFARYIVFAATAYSVFLSSRFQPLKIQPRKAPEKQVYFEIRQSVITALIFALFGLLFSIAREQGYTRIYGEISAYGWPYLIFSFIALVFVHDTYFYWMHRLIHHPKLYFLIHSVHHKSHNPTPFASFSFHPIEAALEFGIVWVAFFLLPLHPLVLFLFSFWSLFWNIIGHLGFEIFPKWFERNWLLQWLNTSTQHNVHHQKINGNYGLYFNFWDKWMGTYRM